MNREDLAKGLAEQPENILQAEKHLHATKMLVVDAKDEYNDRENGLLVSVKEDGSPLIDGKNEAIRQAQLKSMLLGYHTVIREVEHDALCAEREYNFEVNTFRAQRSIAALLCAGALIDGEAK